MIPNFLPGVAGRFVPDHVSMAWLVMLVLGSVAYLSTRRLSEVPGPLQNTLELTIEFFYGIIDGVIGHHGRRYLPLIASLGLFILLSNWLALFPGMKSPTANINTTAGLAMVTFFAYHYIGVREVGAPTYFKHFFGPVGELPKPLLIVMGPIMIPVFFMVEVIGHLSRPVSLAIRLFGNIFGKDTAIVFLFILSWLVIPYVILLGVVYPLAILVGAIQALVWVMLATIYIAGAVEAAHHEGH
jgi:F-type H+-transporting ATPase subunit a